MIFPKQLQRLVLLTIGLVMAGCSNPDRPLKLGEAAPDFVLKDLAGKEVRLNDLRGKVVLVNFWATWCPPCRAEIPSMQKLNLLMTGKPFQMLAVSIDEGGKEAVENFFKQSGGSLPTLLDTSQKTSKKYGTTGVPETFVIDKNGIIQEKVVGAMDWSDPRIVGFLSDLATRK